MPTTTYSRFKPGDLQGLSMEDLISRLSDFLLASGFEDMDRFTEMDGRTLEQLRQAILRTLVENDLLPPELFDQALAELENGSSETLEELLDGIVRRLQDEGYISVTEPGADTTAVAKGRPVEPGRPTASARFEITDKAIDFLGFKTLKDLLGATGRSSFGQHETRQLSTGVEVTGSAKPYEFGDTLNLDVNATLLSAIRHSEPRQPIDVGYDDLHVHQSEYRSSCATVLMLDCSHSMVLYGEDRFTPAKRVALALTRLIRTQYPGDSLHLVLFHDSAEEVPLAQLARVRVGPYYTNTAEGLKLARRVLARERKDLRQIVMITDGKPSALTLDDGRIYRNPFGLDPIVAEATFREVVACRRSGIGINTFMLAHDYTLIAFVKKMTEMVRGKAYFTTPASLGQYVLMDYVNRKTRTIH
ncbi:MAG: VWA domain-containing protein [Acidobacteria bacterium]|nr:VWA domain-containing protein [Acidobacteriota bacterium]